MKKIPFLNFNSDMEKPLKIAAFAAKLERDLFQTAADF
jgi:hypothetical protein